MAKNRVSGSKSGSFGGRRSGGGSFGGRRSGGGSFGGRRASGGSFGSSRRSGGGGGGWSWGSSSGHRTSRYRTGSPYRDSGRGYGDYESPSTWITVVIVVGIVIVAFLVLSQQ